MREDRRFVAGKATFVGDVTPPGTLHAAALASPYAHANIAAIDSAAAPAKPGASSSCGDHLGAEAVDAGNTLLGRVATEAKRRVVHAERRQSGGVDAWASSIA